MSTDENCEGFENPEILGMTRNNKSIYEALLVADPVNIRTLWLKVLDQRITEDNIKYLGKNDLEALLPKAGPRCHFLKLISKTNDNKRQGSAPEEPQIVNPRKRFASKVSLKTIMETFFKGRNLLNHRPTSLTDSERNDLVDCVVQYMNENRLKISRQQMAFFAGEVKDIFSEEPVNIYYTERNGGGNAPSGMLYDKYNYSIKKDKFIPHKKRKGKGTDRKTEPEANEPDEVLVFNKSETYMKTWLQSYEDSNFIDDYWEKTYPMRRAEFSKLRKNITELFTEWPKFTSSKGPEFIRKDFYSINMDNFNNFIDNFDKFSEDIIKHAFSKSGARISRFNPSSVRNTNKAVIDSLFAVSYLIRRSKMNYEHAVRSIIIFNDGQSEHLEHPIILVDQNLESCMIKYKSLKYFFTDFKEALDILLKMYSVFQLMYWHTIKNFSSI